MEQQDRFDRLLKAMASGEPPKGSKESEGAAAAKHRADRADKNRPNE